MNCERCEFAPQTEFEEMYLKLHDCCIQIHIATYGQSEVLKSNIKEAEEAVEMYESK